MELVEPPIRYEEGHPYPLGDTKSPLDGYATPVEARDDDVSVLANSDSEKRDEEADAELAYNELPQGRNLGTLSAVFLMVNRILGTGVFSTTSTILNQSGSVGMSLMYWVIGGLIAGCGFAVYAEFAMKMHRNGGELNYLQYVFRKPNFLTASMFAAQALLLGQAAGKGRILATGNAENKALSAGVAQIRGEEVDTAFNLLCRINERFRP